MNTLLYIYIDAMCSAIIVLHFIVILNRTRSITSGYINLEISKGCFLAMMSTVYLGNNRLYLTQRFVLTLLSVMFTLLALFGTLTGYVGLVLVVPFLLMRLRYA